MKDVVKYDYEINPVVSKAQRKIRRDTKIHGWKTTLLDRVFPGATTLSWTSAAGALWTWLASEKFNDAHRAGLMPNIIVDHHDLPAHYNQLTTTKSIKHGENVWAYNYSEMPNGKITRLVTSHSEIRIYHRALIQNIKAFWNGHAPIEVYQTIMAHTIIHEMLHYITASKLWADQFDDEEHSDERFQQYVHHMIDEIGTVNDEIMNEKMTVTALRQLMLQGLDGPFGPNNLMPVVGGSYDQFKRTKDPLYRKRMNAYEAVLFLFGDYYLSEALVRKAEATDRFWDIVTEQEREARDANEHVIVVD